MLLRHPLGGVPSFLGCPVLHRTRPPLLLLSLPIFCLRISVHQFPIRILDHIMDRPYTLRGLKGSSDILEHPAPPVHILLTLPCSGQEVVVFELGGKVGVVDVDYSHLLD